MSSTSTVISLDEVVDFIHHEAELADAHRLQDWLALWNPERASYVVPYPGDNTEGRLRLAIVRDDYAHLCERIQHLGSGLSPAQAPPSRLCRVIGRVKARDGEDGSVVASSNFMCVESRPDREVLWAGTTIHTIAPRAGSDSLELWRKEVQLVNAQSELPALAFLI
jgi:benzoate/toluate 1,2-dioxygenase beta subunit